MKNEETVEFLDIMKQLMADPKFLTLVEYGKSRHWVQELNLLENHFSDILMWLFDPNEGHGLGDFFIKRFLSSVHITANEKADSTCMSNYKSRVDNETWLDLDEIALCNFGSSIIAREVVVPENQKRIDILIVDPINEIVVTIERKDGSNVHSNQLRRYQDFIEKSYSSYYQLFVLSDSYEKDHQIGEDELDWIQIGDSWLIDALKEAILPGRVDKAMKSRLYTLLCILEESDIDGDSYFKNVEHTMDIFCQNNRETINKLAGSPFLGLESKTLLSEYSQQIKDSNNNWDIAKARILAVKYNVLLNSMAEWGIFEVLKGQLKTMYPQEEFEFYEEKKKIIYFTIKPIAEIGEELSGDQLPLCIGLVFPRSDKSEIGKTSTLPKLEFWLDVEFLRKNVTPDVVEGICQKYNLITKRRWAQKEYLFTSGEEAYFSQNVMNLWVRELVEIANIIHTKYWGVS